MNENESKMSIVNGNTACFKILILGDTGVGKTCLINRFCDNLFAENYVSTVGKLKLIIINCKRKFFEYNLGQI